MLGHRRVGEHPRGAASEMGYYVSHLYRFVAYSFRFLDMSKESMFVSRSENRTFPYIIRVFRIGAD